jgi:hypothetical protein
MEVFNVDDLIGGWFVGSFKETTYKTDAVEVAYKIHTAGETWEAHYHKLSDEINYLISGEMEINGTKLIAPVVFIIPKGEIAAPIFHTDVKLVVVKIPGIPNDKYTVSN